MEIKKYSEKKAFEHNEAIMHSAYFMEGLLRNDYQQVILSSEAAGFEFEEVVRQMSSHSIYMDDLLKIVLKNHLVNGLSGSFEVEVSSEFGVWFSDYLMTNQTIPSVDASRIWIKQCMLKFFSPGLLSVNEINKLKVAFDLNDEKLASAQKKNINVKAYWADSDHICIIPIKDTQKLSKKHEVFDYPINNYIHPSVNGCYSGKILGIYDGIALQMFGINNEYVAHNIKDIHESDLIEGVSVEIQYSNGKGQVKNQVVVQ